MAIEINTVVSVGDAYGKRLGHLTLVDAKFWGRPNFRGEEDRFKDSRRKFTVLIPNDVADQLREIGWNVKTTIPDAEQKAQGMEPVSHLKVFVDENKADVWIRFNDANEKLTPENLGVIDRSRIQEMDMEIRAWEYDPEDQPGEYSARLVTLVANLQPSIIEQKYGRLT